MWWETGEIVKLSGRKIRQALHTALFSVKERKKGLAFNALVDAREKGRKFVVCCLRIIIKTWPLECLRIKLGTAKPTASDTWNFMRFERTTKMVSVTIYLLYIGLSRSLNTYNKSLNIDCYSSSSTVILYIICRGWMSATSSYFFLKNASALKTSHVIKYEVCLNGWPSFNSKKVEYRFFSVT